MLWKNMINISELQWSMTETVEWTLYLWWLEWLEALAPNHKAYRFKSCYNCVSLPPFSPLLVQ